MTRMRVTITPSDNEKSGLRVLMPNLILLSKEQEANCELTSPTQVVIEGNRDALLEILDEIDARQAIQAQKNVAFAVEFERCRNKPCTWGERGAPESSKIDREKLHDLILARLTRHINK